MLKWYVLKDDSNTRQVKPYNILNGSWVDDIKVARKKKKFTTREEFKEWLLKEFRYYYWCKSECEILVGGLFVHDTEELQKIDIYSQLEPNIEVITDYLIKGLNFKFTK